jgi:hypothetical protein
MSFWLKFVSIASVAGIFAWAASAAPLQTSNNGANVGYGYGAAKVTICHIPPGNPSNAHTITVGASAVPAHLAHGDTLGPCPEVAAATQNTGKHEKTNHGKGKSKQNETPTAESSTTEQTNAAPTPQQKQKKPKKEKPVQSNGVGHAPASSTVVTSSNSNGHGNGHANANGAANGNAGGNGNGKGNGKD